MYYKPITVVNDNSSVVNKHETSLTDDARVIIYDHLISCVKDYDISTHFGLYCLQANYYLLQD